MARDTGWTFQGFRVIESEAAPGEYGIKHLGTVPSDYSPFLQRIVNTCDLHGAMLDVTDPVANMRATYDYHMRRSVNTSKEHAMTDRTDHVTVNIERENGMRHRIEFNVIPEVSESESLDIAADWIGQHARKIAKEHA